MESLLSKHFSSTVIFVYLSMCPCVNLLKVYLKFVRTFDLLFTVKFKLLLSICYIFGIGRWYLIERESRSKHPQKDKWKVRKPVVIRIKSA